MRRDGRSVPIALASASAAVIAIALLDYVTPAEMDFGEFYMLPIIAVAWWVGRSAGITFAVATGAFAFAVDAALRVGTTSSDLAIALWNLFSDVFVFAALAVITDVLHREREHWRASDAERTALLRMLERELPRPLRAADWFARTFEDATGGQASAAVRGQFATLRHHTQEAMFLVTDLLAVGRVRAEGSSFQRATIDLRAVVAEAVDGSLDRSRVLFSSTQERRLTVLGDADRLRHAVASVIARFLERSPYEPVSVLVRTSDADAAVEMSCRAPGFEREELELAEQLVYGNGGRLVFVAQGPRGTTVTVYFPCSTSADVPSGPGSELAPRT